MTTEDPRGVPPEPRKLVVDEPKPMGPPTKFNDVIASKICAYIASGMSLPKVAAMEDMPSAATIKRWRRNNPEFGSDYEAAQECRAECLTDEMLEVARDSTRDYTPEKTGPDGAAQLTFQKDNVIRAQMRINTCRYLAERFNRPFFHIPANPPVTIAPSQTNVNMNAPPPDNRPPVVDMMTGDNRDWDTAANAARIINAK